MNSRYCEVDLLSNTASELFWNAPRGWKRVQAVCDWVHNKVTFGYEFSSPIRTALGVYTERVGVCREFQHLAITFLSSSQYPSSLCHWISRRYRSSPGSMPHGFQRVV